MDELGFSFFLSVFVSFNLIKQSGCDFSKPRLKTCTLVLCAPLFTAQSSEGNITCKSKPTLVSQTYHRMDLFNRKMRDVLFTSVLVTINGNHTLGHFGTSDGRILQVAIFGT